MADLDVKALLRPIRGCATDEQYQDVYARVETALLSAIEAGRAAGPEWRPISEAPKDGTTVLVWAAPFQDLPGFQSTASYHPDAGWCVDELRDVTHFMPLPAPPKEAA